MAFNSNTYHMNKYRREAYEHLARARAAKVARAAGEFCVDRVESQVKLARIANHLYLSRRRLRELMKR